MNILVLAAHPDDEIIGCGGTLARHIRMRDDVYIIVLADGVTSRAYRAGISRSLEIRKMHKQMVRRKMEFFSAAKAIGVGKRNCFYLDYPDQRLDAVPLLDLVKDVERLVRTIKPDLVYTHHWGDINKDHRICCEVALTVFRPTGKNGQGVSILSFEVSGNMNVLPPKAANRFLPGCFVDITAYIELKLQALKIYKSELLKPPHPRAPQMIAALAKAWGRRYGCKYAEVFQKLR